jgi:hypothetical protein
LSPKEFVEVIRCELFGERSRRSGRRGSLEFVESVNVRVGHRVVVVKRNRRRRRKGRERGERRFEGRKGRVRVGGKWGG